MFSYEFGKFIPFNFFFDYFTFSVAETYPYYTIENTDTAMSNLKCALGYFSTEGVKGMSEEDYKTYSNNEYFLN